MPEEAKNYRYTLLLKTTKEGPSIERKGSVISASQSMTLSQNHPDAISISFSEIREVLKITTPEINIFTQVQVFDNDPI